jgi:hypothetical protein
MRDDTTEPHPLFSGDEVTYVADRRWRLDVPRAAAGGLALDAVPHAEWMARACKAS